jgi:hypothetical protein
MSAPMSGGGTPAPRSEVAQPVEVFAVTHHELPEPKLWGAYLDRPTVGEAVSADLGAVHSLELEGWALGREVPVEAVELVQLYAPLWRVPTYVARPDVAAAFPAASDGELCGFYGTVASPALTRQFELTVRALLEDGSAVDLATIEGRRPPLRSSYDARLQPLMVTTPGRTGSTALMRLLEPHPQVVAYRPTSYEPRVASYWLDLLGVLSDPSSYLRQITHAINLNDRTWWLGTRTPAPRRLLDPELQRWMGSDCVEDLTAFCHSRIDALYDEVAALGGHRDAVYFMEKYIPNATPSLLWELYPRARELILVRDFRDMVSSILAFDAKRGTYGFGRERGESEVDYVQRLGHRASKRLLWSLEERGERSHVVRYEDLVSRPREIAEGIVAYLELDSSQEVLEAMVASLTEKLPEMDWHRTTRSADSSIGRWREDLSDELKEASETAFRPALEAFGYELQGGSGA